MHMTHDLFFEAIFGKFISNIIRAAAYGDDADESEEEESEESEEGEADIDDELLGELGDDALEEDDLLDAELDPLLKAEEGFGEIDEHEGEKDADAEDDEDDEDVDDYDSFDDKDEM